MLGGEEVRGLVGQAKGLYEGEGLLVLDGSRKRTLGGIFFFLAKEKIGLPLWWEVDAVKLRKEAKKEKARAEKLVNKPEESIVEQSAAQVVSQSQPDKEVIEKAGESIVEQSATQVVEKAAPAQEIVSKVAEQPVSKAAQEVVEKAALAKNLVDKTAVQVVDAKEQQIKEFNELVKQASEWQKGVVNTVKITVVGKPGKVQYNNTYVMFIMESSKAPLSLPPGLPQVSNATNYLVMVANKQWQPIEKALAANPENLISAEGYSTVVPGLRGICVLVQTIALKKAPK